MSSNPADWWGPEPPKAKPSGGRVVRLLTDDDEAPQDATKPEVLPFVAESATGTVVTRLPKRETPMPKGVYDRSKSKPRGDAAPAVAKRPRKARALAVVAKVAKPALDAAKARFDVSVDLRGGTFTINASSGSLTLAPDEVLALFAFLARR